MGLLKGIRDQLDLEEQSVTMRDRCWGSSGEILVTVQTIWLSWKVGLKWATVIGWSPLIVEGDSSLIIFMATRLQAGSSTSKISRNWRWESRIEELFSILQAFPAVKFRYIRRKGNSVADATANKGVGAGISFQSAFPNQAEEKEFFCHCQTLAEADYINHIRLLSSLSSSVPL